MITKREILENLSRELEDDLSEQLQEAIAIYCNDTGVTQRELLQGHSAVEIIDILRLYHTQEFDRAFANLSDMGTGPFTKILWKMKMRLAATGALPSELESGWIQCPYQSKNLFPEGNHRCGYWMRAGAEYCLNCGHKLSKESTHWSETARRVSFSAMIVIALLTLCLHVPVPVTFRWIGTVIGVLLFAAAAASFVITRKKEAEYRAAENAKRPPETLVGALLNLRKKRNKLLTGIEQSDKLLNAGGISTDEVTLLKQANERRNRQLSRVESEMKKISFLRWQNQVERALDAVQERNMPPASVETFLKQLEDEGESLCQDWTDKEAFGKEAKDRISTLIGACAAGRKMVKRRQVLAALQDANVDDGAARSTVLTDVELRGEQTEAIKLKTELASLDFLETDIALEGMRLESLNELDEKDEKNGSLLHQ